MWFILWYCAVLLFLYYVFVKFLFNWNKSNVCMVGKTCLIIGGYSGIGYQTVLGLAARGARVIIADKEDCTERIRKAIEETNNSNIEYKYLNLASFESIRKFAKELTEQEGKLDVLINNAGMSMEHYFLSEDNLHLLMQVNYFGHFLLIHLLIDLLKKSSPSRIIWTASSAAFASFYLTPSNLNPSKTFANKGHFLLSPYANSKLASLIAVKEFSTILEGSNVTINALHPGIVNTSLFSKSWSIMSKILYLHARLFGRTRQEGAQTLLYLACANEVKNVSGKLFWHCREFVFPPQMKSESFRRSIWKQTEDLIGLQEHEKLRK